MPRKPALSEAAPPSDMEILAPEGVEWEWGGRKYLQEPLSLVSMTIMLKAIFKAAQDALGADALQDIVALDTKGDDKTAVAVAAAPAIIKVLTAVPEALPGILGAMVGTSDDEDIAVIAKYCRPVDAMAMIRIFMEQNEPAELIANFFAVKAMFSEAMEIAKEATTE